MPKLRPLFDSYLDRRLSHIPTIDLPVEKRLSLFRRYGDFSLAFSTAVQPNLKYFGDEDGYIAFATKMGYTFALGDPVAAPEERAVYIRAFVAASKKPCFVQTNKDTAAVLASLGYDVNHLGIDTSLVLPIHLFAGRKNESIRYSQRWLIKNGYVIAECQNHEISETQLLRVSNDWRAGRIVRRREMRFLNRPFLAELAPGMRRFVIFCPEKTPLAFLDCDPMSREGVIVGYTTAFKRKMRGTSSHAEIGLTKYAADRFREEGLELLTLGLSPLAAIAKSEFPDSAIWRGLYSRAFRSRTVNRRVFNVQGQAAFKRRFHGEEFTTYIAFQRGSPFEMLALLRLLKTL